MTSVMVAEPYNNDRDATAREELLEQVFDRNEQHSSWLPNHQLSNCIHQHSLPTLLFSTTTANKLSETTSFDFEDDAVLCDEDLNSEFSFDNDMENNGFDKVTWPDEGQGVAAQAPDGTFGGTQSVQPQSHDNQGARPAMGDDIDNAGIGDGYLECEVGQPLKENDGTKDSYVSYQVNTKSDFPSFAKPLTTVRRRFTDFVFLFNTLSTEYPASAIPPLPDKHSMLYVTGDRFNEVFLLRRANSLHRFLRRLTLHPVLRRSVILSLFLESQDWNATMRNRPTRNHSHAEGQPGVFDNITETFMGAFTKVHKADKRFIEVRERSDKLDEDLGHVEKIFARVVRREDDISKDMHELGEHMLKLTTLEPMISHSVQNFTASVEDTSVGMRQLKEHTDQDYLGSLRDMQSYSTAVKLLLKARETKQVDFEQTTAYLADTTSKRDVLASSSGHSRGLGGAIRSKVEDIRGVDHEQSRRIRLREMELRIDELTRATEEAKRQSEAFDEQVVREVHDFERIKRIEFKTQFHNLTNAHIKFYQNTASSWEKYIKDMEAEDGQIDGDE